MNLNYNRAIKYLSNATIIVFYCYHIIPTLYILSIKAFFNYVKTKDQLGSTHRLCIASDGVGDENRR